ncbi:extracellular solute-binding protein [Acidisoma silvae]|uniref:Extracellular solute-binding protein n=1 Tax=Acidisoma silvae TaxID=2802396 RepID=A0A964E0H2_9PROT|nr:extracellular solute-binding protein [Acidisoma silvae]MCB8877154.1 extracellular solute-binding protein [Acidisoma silvae]
MNDLELLRILDFLQKLRLPWTKAFPQADGELVWQLLHHLISSVTRGEVVTISALAQAGYAPYTTALRKVEELVEDGLIARVPRTKTGKSFALQPSVKLKRLFESYLVDVKRAVAQTLGSRGPGEASEDYYFGASPIGGSPGAQQGKRFDLRFLLAEDNYFVALQNMWADLRTSFGSRRDFTLARLPQLYQLALENAQRPVSQYDIVAINIPWMGEFAAKGFIRPLSNVVRDAGLEPGEFHADFWATGKWRDTQYGMPIYCTIETLAVRRDLFQEANIGFPSSFEQVLAAGQALHAPAHGRYGITWNAARGMPVAASFLFLLGDCGSFLLDRSAMAAKKPVRPVIEMEAGLRVLDYMHRLIEISPPGVTEFDWEASLDTFLTGHAAMTYCWSMRAARFEYDTRSKVGRKVEYLPHPAGPKGKVTAPIGGFVLAVPSNLPEERMRLAVDAIAWITSPDTVRDHLKSGLPVRPRFSVISDPEVMQSSPIVNFVERVARRDLLDSWQRPPIPEYVAMEAIIGEEIHDALIGRTADRAALASAQRRIDALFRHKSSRRAA